MPVLFRSDLWEVNRAHMKTFKRETSETDIEVKLDIYGEGNTRINTGIGFFDHMLELFGRHGFMDLEVKADGDLEVDYHHTVEDTGIVLGRALNECLGSRGGITRYGDVLLPMDDVLLQAAVDLGGRSYYQGNISADRKVVNGFPLELLDEFFCSVTDHGFFNLHLLVRRTGNAHHLAEACFKAAARALDSALKHEKRLDETPLSTKGQLEEGKDN
ncbi:imidazoleglycerol-phosphate dehydratase [Halarsenatibacter silvermanii]|uniref:Imidazoleglycerol-phosphate dehydratase n=2 Tax=Halarsenatibacter silvermanii TaxID=321763 RepID=A0A1G9NFZ7_9FIRM|nr:imidazoleglycerol-phosphate dehydratase [Halarsenatibacter silvermanii]